MATGRSGRLVAALIARTPPQAERSQVLATRARDRLCYTRRLPNDVRPLEIDDEMRDAIVTASDSGNQLTVAYNGDDGWPHVSRRGSTQVFGPQQLAIWVRKGDDGLAKAVASRPQVTLLYLDLVERGVVYTFYGLGVVADDPAVNDRVWTATPEGEQAQDPERRGVALVIELQRIVAQGLNPERNFVMERTTARSRTAAGGPSMA